MIHSHECIALIYAQWGLLYRRLGRKHDSTYLFLENTTYILVENMTYLLLGNMTYLIFGAADTFHVLA